MPLSGSTRALAERVRARAIELHRRASSPLTRGVEALRGLLVNAPANGSGTPVNSIRRFRSAFEHAAVGIAILDREATVVEMNAAFEDFLGADAFALLGRPLLELVEPADEPIVRALLEDVGSSRRPSGSVEVRFARRDAATAWGALTISASSDRGVRGLIAVAQDITARKALEKRLSHQAFHDPLTELANRALFRDRIDHALERNMRRPEHLAVLILDLDDFKAINDTQGHSAGDRVLKQVAHRLLNATRGCDTVARLGGDEFGVLLEQAEIEAGTEIVAQRIIAALRTPVDVEPGRTVTVGASVGIAVYSGRETTEELLRNADLAMYESKARAPGRWLLFHPEMHSAIVDRVALERDLQRALQRCQFVMRPRLADTGTFTPLDPPPDEQAEFAVAYQPVIDLATRRVTGLEALARWTHPERGPISPEVFIPLAERGQMILSLGRWLLGTACRQTARWNAEFADEPMSLTVNVSGRQLAHEGFASEVAEVLQESRLAPENLVLEVTESVILQDTDATLLRLRALKQLGVRLSIQDFGTAYSSLSLLQQFPLDVVKIDRSFVRAMEAEEGRTALARTIIALAGTLSLRTVAEGVEDPRLCDELRAMGCDAVQGFVFGQPVPAAELERMLAVPAARGAVVRDGRRSRRNPSES